MTTANRIESFVRPLLADFPWTIEISDWTGRSYSVGRGEPHWYGLPLTVEINTEMAGKELLALDGLGFLDRFLDGEVDFHGNLYLLSDIRRYADLRLNLTQFLKQVLLYGSTLFQNKRRARRNVKSHYDIPQAALDVYLDKVYKSYSCAIFDKPERLLLNELRREGTGKGDDFDSLERAQWRKFKDAVDFIAPKEGETLLDVGCGYGGQLQVALEEHPFGTVVGWTHSRNQVEEGRQRLAGLDRRRWELHEGDYRLESRVFDHLTSTGMVSHIGPRGLVPYVQNVRRLIRPRGRYVHHALMAPFRKRVLDAEIGITFNKRYVWPGFHWFTLGDHTKALERNGFAITKVVNLSPHYCKTTATWYERMMQDADLMREIVGERTFRAWRIYLSGASAGFRNGLMQVHRIYCTAV